MREEQQKMFAHRREQMAEQELIAEQEKVKSKAAVN